MKKQQRGMGMTVAEFFADSRRDGEFGAWLWKAGLDATGIQKFEKDWWLLVRLMSHPLLNQDSPDLCDLSIEGTVIETLQSTLKALFSYPSQHAAFVRHFTTAFKKAVYYGDEDVYLPEQVMSWESLYRQYAEVYAKWYMYAGAEFGWEISDKLIPQFRHDEDIIFVMHVSHGLIQDHPHNPLSFMGMPEYRWAFNGEDWAWFPIQEVILQGSTWYTKKHYNKLHPKMKGFA